MFRQSISKSKRFDIFKRDKFTCRYCGSKAPDVKLEIDHRIPVSHGGGNSLDNLVTACFDCNRGKHTKRADVSLWSAEADRVCGLLEDVIFDPSRIGYEERIEDAYLQSFPEDGDYTYFVDQEREQEYYPQQGEWL